MVFYLAVPFPSFPFFLYKLLNSSLVPCFPSIFLYSSFFSYPLILSLPFLPSSLHCYPVFLDASSNLFYCFLSYLQFLTYRSLSPVFSSILFSYFACFLFSPFSLVSSTTFIYIILAFFFFFFLLIMSYYPTVFFHP